MVREAPEIRILPVQLVNKIAAGECIERPASVVKELVENALDAQATRIDVHVEQGGCKLVRVVDNGSGIAAEQLPLAAAPHATSKVRDENDLYAIGTMGFRGEALASVAAVSIVRISSVREGAASGGTVEVVDGQCSAVTPYAGAVGTTVEMQNLFYNTPARRKFLKSAQTEFGHVQEQLVRIALTRTDVAFDLHHNDRRVLELPVVESPRDRIRDLFGAELADGLLQVFCQDGTFTLQAYVCRPEDSKPSTRWQYFFVNRRPVRDRYLAHALREAYRGLISGERQPVAFLFLDLDPTFVDVNVHPTKSEVRFSDPGQVHSLILGGIRDRFLSADLPARLMPETPEQPPPPAGRDRSDAGAAAIRQSVTKALADYLRSAPPVQPALKFDAHHPKPTPTRQPPETPVRPQTPELAPTETEPPVPSAPAEPQPQELEGKRRLPQPALQIHNTYLVVQTDEGFMIIDQHALHERVLYQQLREHLDAGPMPRQRLLVPQVVNLTARHMAQIESIRPKLHEVGLEIEPFGPTAIAIHSLPALIDQVDAEALVEELLGRLEDQIGPQSADVVEQILESLACKGAVKAGDPLTPDEIQALLDYRRKIDLISTCPHGRPTALQISLDELRKRFRRT